VSVEIGADKSIRFAEDLNADSLPSMMSADALDVFDKAGIMPEMDMYAPDTDTYMLADDGNDGSLHIRKETLNAALDSGALKIDVDEKGILRFE
jgi:hypothetical protein